MYTFGFNDKNGQSLSLRTNLANVNIDVTPLHDLELAEWDKVKPNLGTMDQDISSFHTVLAEWDKVKPNLGMMDQGIPSFHAVVVSQAVALSESFQPPAQVVPEETWMEKWDRTKPDLGTMSLPRIVVEEPEEPGM